MVGIRTVPKDNLSFCFKEIMNKVRNQIIEIIF